MEMTLLQAKHYAHWFPGGAAFPPPPATLSAFAPPSFATDLLPQWKDEEWIKSDE